MVFEIREGTICMSKNAKGEGQLATLARGHLDCRSFDTSKDIFFKMAGPISIKFQCTFQQ